MRSLAAILDDIKVQHTVFALPFAVMTAFVAAGGWPSWRLLGLIVLALLLARSAAMAFNRFVDAPFDRDNPRTAGRSLPAGRVSRPVYVAFILAVSIGFVLTCGAINILALKLAPLALLVVFFYSYTKRFTPYSHFFLGAALALAPVGAWVAVREEVGMAALVIGGAVVFWLAGLDTIYSCQDVAFDRRANLNSIPARYGVPRALKLSAAFHGMMVALLAAAGMVAGLSWIYYAGVAATAAMLWYEHSLVRPDDLTRVNVAFFNVNGMISVGLMLFTVTDVLTYPPGL